MHFLWTLLLFVVVATGTLAQNTTASCDNGYWGKDCQNVCGACSPADGADVPICNAVTGECPSGCLGGYSGGRCDQAECKGGCGPGECLAPNYCGNCGSINHVTPNCEDIRIRGLLGSLIAFIVVLSSISLCGLGSVWYKRRQSVPVHL